MIQGLAISVGALGLVLTANGAAQDDRAYFPRSLYETKGRCGLLGLGGTQEAMSDFTARWYAEHLRAAGEGPLSDMPGPTLRFTWLRTFHAPVVIRVGPAANGGLTLTATEL